MARPTKYSEDIVNRICDQIATTSNGLVVICEDRTLPSVRTIYNWLNDPQHLTFLHKYTRAREEQADFLADEIIAISDDGTNDYMTITKGDVEYNIENKEVTSRSKLRVDARKWKASKLAPKKYGDKLDLTSKGEQIKSFVIELTNEADSKTDGSV
jgi:hypothetical protein